MKPILYLPIKIPYKDCHETIFQILSTIKYNWPREKIKIGYITSGTTNNLITASCEMDDSNTNVLERDIVLFRIYGNKTELLIDREQEIQNMVALHSFGLGSELYCAFENGLCYEFANGTSVNIKTVLDPKIYFLIAHKLAKMHASFLSYNALPQVKYVYPDGKIYTKRPTDSTLSMETHESSNQSQFPCYFTNIKKWASLLSTFMSNEFRAYQKNNPDNKMDIKQYIVSELSLDPWPEIEYLEQALLPLKSAVVFCHNDLLIDNIIYNKDKNDVTFIDFEFGDFNFQAFEIAQFFCEFVGLDPVDYNLFPSRAFRLHWLKLYYDEWMRLGQANGGLKCKASTEEEIEKLCCQVDKFILAPHLIWGIYSTLQSCVTDKSFDHRTYAKIRFKEYSRLKADPSILLK